MSVRVPRALRAGALLAALVSAGCGTTPDPPGTTLRLYEASEVKTLDPMHSDTVYESRHVMNLFDGLVEFAYLDRPYRVVPTLAESLPEISQDRLTYTFTLRKGVRFHDDPCFPDGRGREVVAEDFVYSLLRIADARNASGGWWFLEGRVEGLDAYHEASRLGKPETALPVAGVRAVDRHTLQLRLTRPYPQLLELLAGSHARVVPREAVERYGKEFGDHPVGTGPYRLAKWVRGSRFDYVRNPTYRSETYPTTGTEEDRNLGLLADAGKPVPFADRVVVHEIVEDQPRWLRFMNGELDLMAPPKDNASDSMPAGKLSPALAARGVAMRTVPSMDVVYLGINMEDPVLGTPAGEKGRALRRAISMAIDRARLVELFFSGRAVPARSAIPPGVDGSPVDQPPPWMRHDPAAARRELEAAGYPGGNGLPEFELITSSGTSTRQRSELFQAALAEVGIRVEVSTMTWPELNRRVRAKQAQMWSVSWQAEFPDAVTVLCAFYGPHASPGLNDSNFRDPGFDALYQQAIGLEAGPERTGLYRRLGSRIEAELPWIPLCHTLIDTLVHPWLRNYKTHEPGMDAYWKYYRIDPEERARRLGSR